ncbi:MAG: DEAD/DEAH box helicase [Oligoflexia bacterium]|nr:DEAD/DEAH box helicase [Oligoflexia bacterium]
MSNAFNLIENSFLSDSLRKILKNFFSDKTITELSAVRFPLEVEITFIKENPPVYTIVAATIKSEKDDRSNSNNQRANRIDPTTHRTCSTKNGNVNITLFSSLQTAEHSARITFRGDGQNLHLNSICDCHKWNKEEHCVHVLIIFIKFYLSKENAIPQISQTSWNKYFPSHLESSKQFLSEAETFNRHTPYANENIDQFLTLSTLQDFQGSLLIIFDNYETTNPANHIPFPLFHLLDKSSVERWNITITKFFHLIDIDNQQIFILPEEIKALLNKIRKFKKHYTFDDYLIITKELRKQKIVSLIYKNQLISDEDSSKKTPINCEISLEKIDVSGRNSIKMSFDFFTSSIRVPPPIFFKLLSFSNEGALHHFLKKADAYLFSNELFSLLKSEPHSHDTKIQHFYHSINKILADNEFAQSIIRDYTNIMVSAIDHETLINLNINEDHNGDSTGDSIGENTSFIFKYSLDLFRSLLTLCINSFGEFFIRSADYSSSNFITYIPLPLFLKKINTFYRDCKKLGINVSYHQSPIKFWNPQITIERNNIKEDWFELCLAISEEDLQLTIDLLNNQNTYIQSDSLVILDDTQHELLHFLSQHLPINKKRTTKKLSIINPSHKISTLIDGDDLSVANNQKTFKILFNRHKVFELFELYKLGFKKIINEDELSLCKQLTSLQGLPKYPIPEMLNVSPRSYQTEGFYWLRFLYENKLGACLADDMGLGKTLQTIMLIKSILNKVNRVLIICPVSIILNWQSEIKKFAKLDAQIYYGGNRSFPQDEKIVLTSYGILRKEYNQILSELRFDILVLDEAHHLKNFRSLGSRAAREVNAQFRLALTGTPVENDLPEFCNIMDICVPGLWEKLNATYRISTDSGDEILDYDSNSNNNNHGRNKSGERFIPSANGHDENYSWIKKISRPFLLRRTKSEVLKDLPEKNDNTIVLNFSKDEKNYYALTLLKIKQRLVSLSGAAQKKYGEIFKGILELRQLCLWQQLSPHSLIISTKIKYLMEGLEQLHKEKHQTIVFSQFTTYLDLIQKEVSARGFKFSRIDGTQSIKRRQQEVELFQNGSNPLFLISLRAGGLGLNLTAASYIFLMDPWWNPAVEGQAIDRAHRIGQKNKLTIYRLIIKDSIEEKVLNLQEHKRKLFDNLLNTKIQLPPTSLTQLNNSEEGEVNSYFSGKLTKEDFEWLLL